jgi:hypothetical protein
MHPKNKTFVTVRVTFKNSISVFVNQ